MKKCCKVIHHYVKKTDQKDPLGKTKYVWYILAICNMNVHHFCRQPKLITLLEISM